MEMYDSGRLLVSISNIYDRTRSDTQALVKEFESTGIPVSLLIAPRMQEDWHLARDPETRLWLTDQKNSGQELILNGFDQAVQGRRAEFASLEKLEARLRLTGALRQMERIGFSFTVFAPPRWQMSEDTQAVLPEFGFEVAASNKGIIDLKNDTFISCRNLSVGEGFGQAQWWRRSVIKAAQRGAQHKNIIRLSVSASKLANPQVAEDFKLAAYAARDNGAIATTYQNLVEEHRAITAEPTDTE